MCGRLNIIDDPFTRALLQDLGLPVLGQSFYNVAPSAVIPAVISNNSQPTGANLRWWLRTSKATDDSRASQNARGEKLNTWWYQDDFRQRRCLVVASGWYEWHGPKSQRQPVYITPASGACLLAGIWNKTQLPDGQALLSCATITVAASPQFAPIHQRFPLMLAPQYASLWLDPLSSITTVQQLVRSGVPQALHYYPVSPKINSARLTDPALCTTPIGPKQSLSPDI